MPDLIPTITPNVESVTPDLAPKTERETINEIVPFLSPNSVPTLLQNTKNKSESVSTTPKVVNKTKEPEILHPVDPKADTLTTIANEEEQEFIKEVMKEHQDGSK